MRKNWLIKLGVPILAFALVSGCGTTNDNNPPVEKEAPEDNIPTENDDQVNPNHNEEDHKNKGEPNNDRDDQDKDTEDINDIDVPNNNKKPLT